MHIAKYLLSVRDAKHLMGRQPKPRGMFFRREINSKELIQNTKKILEENIPCQSVFHSIGLSQVCMKSLLYLSFTLLLHYLLFNMLMEEKEV